MGARINASVFVPPPRPADAADRISSVLRSEPATLYRMQPAAGVPGPRGATVNGYKLVRRLEDVLLLAWAEVRNFNIKLHVQGA